MKDKESRPLPTMWEENKTIIIKEEDLEKWLSALRSGEYPKAHRALRTATGFCCLGVLQMVLDRCTEPDVGLPSHKWLREHGIVFRAGTSRTLTTRRSPAITNIRGRNIRAEECNDEPELDWSFEKIADHIEACAQTY